MPVPHVAQKTFEPPPVAASNEQIVKDKRSKLSAQANCRGSILRIYQREPIAEVQSSESISAGQLQRLNPQNLSAQANCRGSILEIYQRGQIAEAQSSESISAGQLQRLNPQNLSAWANCRGSILQNASETLSRYVQNRRTR